MLSQLFSLSRLPFRPLPAHAGIITIITGIIIGDES
jgi:hypothetical protein